MRFCQALLLVMIAPLWGQSIKRLPPSAFPELPGPVRRALNLRGCTVPQSFLTGPHNVIKGEFARPGQTDWAVLCSVNGVSTILVFWNGSPDNPAAIAPQPDANSVQGITATATAYSREITAVGKRFIMQHYLGYGGPKPPPMNHQGIDDAFLEKASVTYYLYRGKWLQLTGAD
jgi:hypothetical protein